MDKKSKIEFCVVHLDLKGVPPTFERLMDLLDVFKAGGYNAILIEWEDMFPWTVDKRFRCETAYTPAQVKQFHAAAKEKGLEIIPLVQCLGHLETFLKFDDYAHLREQEDKCDCLNPLAEGAQEFISALVDDVLKLSEGIRFFHLGGDEVHGFGKHPDTNEYVGQNGKALLFLNHVQPLIDNLHDKGIRTILWHDMMIDWEIETLSQIAEKTDVCAWGYDNTPYETTRHYKIKYVEKFCKAGITMWGGSAYKGADGPSADIPEPHARRRNALSWVKAAEEFKFRGLIATAWSRYNTTRVQCETIEASLDALIYIGWILAYNQDSIDFEEQAREKLKELGQLERFQKCYLAAKEFDLYRKCFWSWIQAFYEQEVLDETHPARRASETLSATNGNLNMLLEDCEKRAVSFRDALQGLIPQVWIDEYFQTRIEAMRKALEDMYIRSGKYIERPDQAGVGWALGNHSKTDSYKPKLSQETPKV